MRHETFYYPDSSGERQLFAQWWLPEGEPRGILQLVHGINEYGDRYSDVGETFAKRGFVVAIHDHRGHGKSIADGERRGALAAKDGWLHLLEDVREHSRRLREAYPGLPLFLLGHSLGSFAVREILIRWDDPYSGAVIMDSASMPRVLYGLGRAACRGAALFVGRDGVSPFIRDLCFAGFAIPYLKEGSAMAWISRDPLVYTQYVKDPCCRFIPNVAFFDEMLKGMSHMDDPANDMLVDPTLPLLLMAGEKDPVGSMGRGMKKLHRRLDKRGCSDLEFYLFPNCRHELFHEYDTADVYDKLGIWLEKHLL